MKNVRFAIPTILLLGGVGLLWAAPPLLKVDRSKPLMLKEAPRTSESLDDRPVADNEPCLVCHDDFREELLAKEHAKANVGCVKCHGNSAAHRDDEDNTTPPDVMFLPKKIDAACQICHEEHVASARKVIARWQERCPQKTDPLSLICVDCHGAHRRPFRTVEWDKATGKLLVKRDAPKGVPSKAVSPKTSSPKTAAVVKKPAAPRVVAPTTGGQAAASGSQSP